MGASLIGYLVKGPKEITPETEVPADRLLGLGELHTWARSLKAWYQDEAEPETEDPPEPPALVADWPAVRELLDAAENDVFPLASVAEPLTELREFVEWWNGLESESDRDVSFRDDPDDPTQRLLFAGDTSWGDDPEGEGYARLQRAELLGILDLVGIR